MKKHKPYKLPYKARRILLALKNAYIDKPDTLIINNEDEEFLQRCTLVVSNFQKIFRIGFVLGLSVVNRLPFFYGFGPLRFVNLKLSKKRAFLEKCRQSRFLIIRDALTGFRGLVMMSYFSHQDVWKYMDYHPEEHAKERIALRQKLLNQKERGTHNA